MCVVGLSYWQLAWDLFWENESKKRMKMLSVEKCFSNALIDVSELEGCVAGGALEESG